MRFLSYFKIKFKRYLFVHTIQLSKSAMCQPNVDIASGALRICLR